MNILFISQFKINGDGWTEAAKDFARSLLTQDCNLILRNFNMANQQPGNLDDDLKPYFHKKESKYDVVIQKLLPNLITYDSRFKQNILIPAFETELPKTHHWLNRLKIVDKIFTISKSEKTWLSKYHNSVHYIGEAINTNLNNQKYNPIHPIFEQKIFKFYVINSATERKNLDEIIKAYFRAFTINDNVVLVLKTNVDMNNHVNAIKNSMRLYFNNSKYPPIALINNQLSDNEINSIHQYCDCFITASFGEAFSRTAATALTFGNPVISTDNLGISDYLSEETGWLVPSYKTYVNCNQPPLPDLYRGNEFWYRIDDVALVNIMKEAYHNKKKFLLKKENIIGLNPNKYFSYETVGKNMMRALNE